MSSYVYYFKDRAKILSRLGSMSTLKSVQLKKAHVGCVTYPRLSFFLMGRAKGGLKIYALLVVQEVVQLMNAILYTMARLKYKIRYENFLFGLKILFSFFGGEGGEGLGL